MLRSGFLLFIEFSEGLALLGELLHQRSGGPHFAVLLLEFADSFINCFQTNGVRIQHGTTAISRETIAVEIDDIDVHGAQRIALYEDPRALVHKSVEAAIDDFFSRDLALRNSCFGGPLPHQLSHFGGGKGVPLVVIFVPACPGLLAISAELTEIIFAERLSNTGLLQVTIFLADAPTDIETREISCRQRSHSHAEVVERFIDSFNAGALFDEELRFAAIRAKHAVAYETHAIADKNGDFPKSFRKLHASRDDFPVCRFASHDFKQTHDVGRAEKMRSDHEHGAR